MNGCAKKPVLCTQSGGGRRTLACILALGITFSLTGCTLPSVEVLFTPGGISIFQGESATMSLDTGATTCQSDAFGCIDITGKLINYQLRGLPAGTTHELDYSLQTPLTAGLARLTLRPGLNTPPGSYGIIVDAHIDLELVGTRVFTLRVLPAGGVTESTEPAASVAAGSSVSLAVLADGTLWGWGSGQFGLLGDGTTTSPTSPAPIPGITGVKAVSASSHFLALLTDGTVRAWGSNGSGQVGSGLSRDQLVPFPVPSLTEVDSVAAGGSHSLALGTDGTVWSWGNNALGQLGIGVALGQSPDECPFAFADIGPSCSLTPVQVVGLNDAIAIAAGGAYSLALRADGTVLAWGSNSLGQLGIDTDDGPEVCGTSACSRTPARVVGIDTVTAIAAGGPLDDYSMALRADGSVWHWGDTLRTALLDSVILEPARVDLFQSARAIAVGSGHSLVLVDCGAVWAWGNGEFWQLGDGTGRNRVLPVRVSRIGDDGTCDAVGLRLSKSGAGEGTMGDDTGVLSCGPGCLQDVAGYALGSAVTVTANPAEGSTFEGWRADCAGSDPEIALALDTDIHCTAVFHSPEPFLLTMHTPNGRVTSTAEGLQFGTEPLDCEPVCQAIFDEDTPVGLSATPFGGFELAGWDQDCTGSALETTVLMDRTRVCRANYRAFEIAVSVSGSGIVTSAPEGIHCGSVCDFAPRNGTVRLFAAPEPGWQLVGWGGDCSGSDPSVVVPMAQDRACSAEFGRIPNTYFLELQVSGQGMVTSDPAGIDCHPSCSALFAGGTAVNLFAVPDPGWVFVNWFLDCPGAPGNPETQIIIDADSTCEAGFARDVQPDRVIAELDHEPATPQVGEVVLFDGGLSRFVDGETAIGDPERITFLAWDFEDDGSFEAFGDRDTALVTQHAFSTIGFHTVYLKVTGSRFVNPLGLILQDDTRVEVAVIGHPSTPVRSLNVLKAGSGDGTVGSSPPGLFRCESGCAAAGPVSLQEGNTITLTAEADFDSVFTGWSGDCAGTAQTTDVTIGGDTSCTATFEPDSLTACITPPPGNLPAFNFITHTALCSLVPPERVIVDYRWWLDWNGVDTDPNTSVAACRGVSQCGAFREAGSFDVRLEIVDSVGDTDAVVNHYVAQ